LRNRRKKPVEMVLAQAESFDESAACAQLRTDS
jgi:hypothetical protein